MKGSLCLIPSALLLLCKLGSVTKTGSQVPVILQVYFFSEEGSAVLLSEEPVATPEKSHTITGCGCNGISAGWGRWEGCAVKQGTAALFSLP